MNSKRRGFNMIEMTVSMGVMAFIFASLGFMVFLSARNSMNIRDQILSQTSASACSERIAMLFRKASYFTRVTADQTTAGPYTRMKFIVADNSGTTSTQLICYDQVKEQVMYFADASRASFGTTGGKTTVSGTSSLHYTNISDFQIVMESEYRLTLRLFYKYRGFALYFNNPTVNQKGQFITDIIARNHYMDQNAGGSYASADDPTTGPATL